MHGDSYLEDSSLTIVTHSSGSRFSGLRSDHPFSNLVDSEERSSEEACSHLSLCQPFILEILEGGLDRRVRNFLLLFAKQCFVIIRKSLLFIPPTSTRFAGFMVTNLELIIGDGVNELGGTLLSKNTSKSSQMLSPNGPMS